MSRKIKALIALGVLLGVILVSGITIIAVTSLGTQSDPLITLSYLNSKFKPEIMDELKTEIAKASEDTTKSINDKIDEFKTEIGNTGTGTAQTGTTETFKLVSLTKGQALSCSVGSELLLRIGTATASGVAPALVNETTGSVLAVGGAVVANNMYLVTIEGNGLKATADVKVLVCGEYTIK